MSDKTPRKYKEMKARMGKSGNGMMAGKILSSTQSEHLLHKVCEQVSRECMSDLNIACVYRTSGEIL
jgi:hypothetical protein